jgi:hypothetical protein
MKIMNTIAILVFTAAIVLGTVFAVSGSDTITESIQDNIDYQKTCSGDGSCNGECDGSCGKTVNSEEHQCPMKAAGTCPKANSNGGTCGNH